MDNLKNHTRPLPDKEKVTIARCGAGLYQYVAVLVLFWATHSLPQTTLSGNIESVISSIVSIMPGNGSNAFVIPENANITDFEEAFARVLSGNYSSVQSFITPYSYTFYKFIHLPTQDTLYMFRENSPVQRGWGTYLYNPATKNDFTVEVPHPLWDRNSWELGIKAFIRSKAKWFLMAGTHRYANADTSSDMAHVTQSVFHAAHKKSGAATALQVHGFDGSSPGYNGYPLVVISNGTLYPSTVYYTLRDNYEAQGFSAGVFSYSTYNQLRQLGATTNEQGKWSNANGKKFVHIEHDQPLRFDSANLSKCASIITKTFGVPNSIRKELPGPGASTLLSAYPNPFNPATSVKISLKKSGFGILTVYNSMGERLATLFSGWLPAGDTEIFFDAGKYSTGILFCTLQSENHSQTLKLLLLK